MSISETSERGRETFKQKNGSDGYLNERVSIQVRYKSERNSRKLHRSIITNDLLKIRKEWKVRDWEGEKISNVR